MTTPEELQQAQEELQRVKEALNKEQLEAQIDPIEITKEIEDKFILSLEEGTPFKMSFSFSPSHKIVIRDKTVREDEIAKRSVNRLLIKSGSVNWAEYSRIINECFLYYQLEEVNGVQMIRKYPNSIYDDFNLYEQIENSSFILSMPLTRLYVYMATMFQFNAMCQTLARKATTDRNFFL